ncbi:unnamed protein product [Victoria cruziana]
MPGLLPNIDPDGLLEFSVVYTDRALNHMSKRFQGVMTDISGMLKQVYNAHSAVLVPGSGTFGMESVARQFAQGKHVMVIRNGWFSFRWTQIFDMGQIPASHTVLKAPGPGVCTPRGNRGRHDPARRLPQGRGRCGACRGRPVRARLHRLGRHVGRHEGHRGGRADLCPAKGLEQLALLRHGHAQRAGPPGHRRHAKQHLRHGPQEVRAEQIELGRRVRALLESRGFPSVAASGFQAPGVVVSYTTDPEIQSSKKFLAVGLQTAAGVPLQCDEPADFRSFRIGLFGLEKWHQVERTLEHLAHALDQVAPSAQQAA